MCPWQICWKTIEDNIQSICQFVQFLWDHTFLHVWRIPYRKTGVCSIRRVEATRHWKMCCFIPRCGEIGAASVFSRQVVKWCFLFSDIPKRLKEMSHLRCLQSCLIPVVCKTVGLQTVGTRQGSVERAVEFLSAQWGGQQTSRRMVKQVRWNVVG